MIPSSPTGLAGHHILNPTQDGMLLHALTGAEPGVDVEQLVCCLSEAVDVEKLRQVWQYAVKRHAALRTRFDWTSSPAMQVVEAPWPVEIVEINHAALEPAEQERRFEEFLREDRRRGFDLSRLPLMRVTLIRLGAADYRLVWTFHHAILDGRSFTLLLEEIFEQYDARRTSGTAPDPDLPPPYADYLQWLAGHFDEASARTFWQEYLAGLVGPVALNFAPSVIRESGGREGHGTVSQELSVAATRRLKELATAGEVTLNTVVQAAWALLLHRYFGNEDVVFGVTRACRHVPVAGADRMTGVFINTLPLRVRLDPQATVREFLGEVRRQHLAVRPQEHTPLSRVHGWSELGASVHLFETLLVFENYDLTERLQQRGGTWSGRRFELHEQTNYALALYGYGGTRLRLKLGFARTRLGGTAASHLLGHLEILLEAMASRPEARVSDLPLLSPAEGQRLIHDWNDTVVSGAAEACIHQLIRRQAAREPGQIALVCRDQELRYQELEERSNQLARHLRKLGVGPETLVGVMLDRSLELVVGLLGILKAGGAYVPLDPTYPRERVEFMFQDSGALVILTQKTHRNILPSGNARVVVLDDEPESRLLQEESCAPPPDLGSPEQLAYLIYTSGSSGQPKGVMVEHRNVANFFAGMDERLGTEPGVWLAVTSISFDISVLELFWTLARGFKVVLVRDEDRLAAYDHRAAALAQRRPIDFSLFYFASEMGGEPSERYRLLLDGAKFADENGFAAVWTPERHFHSFGGLYSNPSVAGAALATITRRIGLRAGSVVSPLHHPVRLAEEWALVDNLSGGRVGLSFASGWQANDFALAPERFADRKRIMFEDLATVRRLWRGEAIALRNGDGQEVSVRIFPTPIQKELPVWVTAAANPETFRQAGECGANVLTHLLGQKFDEVEAKIRIYRQARAAAGWEGPGTVTLMLHTYVGECPDAVKAAVRDPMCRYLGTSLELIRNAPFAFPTFKVPSAGIADKVTQGLKNFSPDEMQALLGFAFERYYETSGLFGTVERCLEIVERCRAADVDEIGCLIDFGVPTEPALEGLRHLNEVRQRSNRADANPAPQVRDYSILAQLEAHEVTHLQCTPSLLRLLADQTGGLEILSRLKRLMVGGEALPLDLMNRLRQVVRGEIHNMYGPTETTVWSTTDRLKPDEEEITIGRPIANTQIRIVDPKLRPVPVGVPGELLIGGLGVVRGYLNRPELTRERFIPDPFGSPGGGRLYRTGDLAAWRADGRIEFLGRLDHQVKIRGHRIEMGEIEHVLCEQPGVAAAAVVPRERRNGESELAAFYVPAAGQAVDSAALRTQLEARLPDYMIPAVFTGLKALPTTPNGKIDRKALAAMKVTASRPEANGVPPASELEKQIAMVFTEALEVDGLGMDQNFFDLGANSLSLVRVAARLGELFPGRVGLVDLFQRTTLRSLAEFLGGGQTPVEAAATRGSDRGRQRRESLLQRRRG